MLNKKLKHKNLFSIFTLRMLFGLLLFDEKNILIKKQTQLHLLLPHYLDRLFELIYFYPTNLTELYRLIKKYGYPTSELYKENFDKAFTRIDPNELFASYKEFDLLYTARLMLTYNRVDFVVRYLDLISANKINSVLDYGCGVSDVGILLAKKGLSVSIADLDTPKLKFTIKRFKSRGLAVIAYSTNDTERLVDITEKFDLIIATEILEHYRHPIDMINYFYEHLNKNGYVYISMGKTFKRESGGDHLDESFVEGNSFSYKENFLKKFVSIDDDYYLFRKL